MDPSEPETAKMEWEEADQASAQGNEVPGSAKESVCFPAIRNHLAMGTGRGMH